MCVKLNCWSVVVKVERCGPSWMHSSALHFNGASTLASFLKSYVLFTDVQR